MTIEASVESTIAAGVVDELLARVAGLSDVRSGPGPPVTLVIAGRHVEPGPDPLFVGRSAAAFGIDHPRVSRRHVGVQLVDGVVIATDLGSRNGTWLVRDDERSPLTAMTVLRPGDRLVTLDDVELVHVVEVGVEVEVVGGVEAAGSS
jgi:pSer/pThr/pTyr-binding forkhead associated (FHA) protein